MSTSSEDIVVAAAARTPFGRFGGALRRCTLSELGAVATVEAMRRANIGPELVDEFALGVNLPGSDRSIARQAALASGIPDDRCAYTIDRACCSSMTAISLLVRSIRVGDADIGVAGGSENMSRVPYYLEDMRWGHRLGDVRLVDQLVLTCPYTGVPRALQASNEARIYGVTREAQDEWALRSQSLYSDARTAGRVQEELVPVDLKEEATEKPLAWLTEDECPRPETSLEGLSRLPTVYGSDSVTAGNAPAMASGASSIVLMTRGLARERNTTPLATILASAMVSGDPNQIASVPAAAAMKALAKANLTLDEVKLIEINEAFAAVPLVATLELADRDQGLAGRLRERVNVNGGAIAVGHPTGATGARLVMTVAYELRRRGGGVGLAAICGGIGEAEAILLRVED